MTAPIRRILRQDPHEPSGEGPVQLVTQSSCFFCLYRCLLSAAELSHVRVFQTFSPSRTTPMATASAPVASPSDSDVPQSVHWLNTVSAPIDRLNLSTGGLQYPVAQHLSPRSLAIHCLLQQERQQMLARSTAKPATANDGALNRTGDAVGAQTAFTG